jgi:GAF domain-containing protein
MWLRTTVLRSNSLSVVEDVKSDPRTSDVRAAFCQFGICADVVVPLHKAGRLVAAMAVHQFKPLKWRPDEVDLIQHVVDRCWESRGS